MTEPEAYIILLIKRTYFQNGNVILRDCTLGVPPVPGVGGVVWGVLLHATEPTPVEHGGVVVVANGDIPGNPF